MSPEVNSKGRIVVGTDTSPRATIAVDWAADRAVARKLPLLVVYAIPDPNWNEAVASDVRESYRRDYIDLARSRVDEVVQQLRARHPGLDVAGVAVEGHPSNLLAEASRDAELVVVGARGEHAPLAVRLLGGVSDAVTTHAHGPIAVVADEAHENPTGPVVVGVDNSEAARAAIRLAFEAARVRGVPVIAVHAVTHGRSESGDMSRRGPLAADYQKELLDLVNQELADDRARHPEVPVEVRLVRERPKNALVETSRDAGLLVVGSRGLGGFRGLLLGSTSKHVLREAHCPVIVTR